jgi:hypothetical protein
LSLNDKINEMQQPSYAKAVTSSSGFQPIVGSATCAGAVPQSSQDTVTGDRTKAVNPVMHGLQRSHSAMSLDRDSNSSSFLPQPRGRKHQKKQSANKRDVAQGSTPSLDRVSVSSYEVPRTHKKKQKRNKFISGTVSPNSSAFKGAPMPDRHLFIYRVDKSASDRDISAFLVARQFNVRELTCVSNENAKFKSFKLTVPVTEYSNLFDGNLWPAGVRVRKYISPKSEYSS